MTKESKIKKFINLLRNDTEVQSAFEALKVLLSACIIVAGLWIAIDISIIIGVFVGLSPIVYSITKKFIQTYQILKQLSKGD